MAKKFKKVTQLGGFKKKRLKRDILRLEEENLLILKEIFEMGFQGVFKESDCEVRVFQFGQGYGVHVRYFVSADLQHEKIYHWDTIEQVRASMSEYGDFEQWKFTGYDK